eukprot:6529877-Pyramimonas_sp.AAC.1
MAARKQRAASAHNIAPSRIRKAHRCVLCCGQNQSVLDTHERTLAWTQKPVQLSMETTMSPVSSSTTASCEPSGFKKDCQ